MPGKTAAQRLDRRSRGGSRSCTERSFTVSFDNPASADAGFTRLFTPSIKRGDRLGNYDLLGAELHQRWDCGRERPRSLARLGVHDYAAWMVPNPAALSGSPSPDARIDDRLLDPATFARLMGVSEHDVLQALANGELISIQRSPRNAPTESGIPAFLAHESVRGAPLSRVLAAFRDPQTGGHGNLDAVQAYMFLTGRNELLGGLTPTEVLTGVANIAPEDPDAPNFLAQGHAERVEIIAQVATTWVAALRSW